MKCNENSVGFTEDKNVLSQEISVLAEQYEAPRSELIELTSAKINGGCSGPNESCAGCFCPY